MQTEILEICLGTSSISRHLLSMSCIKLWATSNVKLLCDINPLHLGKIRLLINCDLATVMVEAKTAKEIDETLK